MSRLDRITEEEWRELALNAQGSVALLAKSCGVSRRQLQRFIWERWGAVPVRWLNEARLKHAPLLLEKGLSVKEVATALGYENASHFTNAFKAFYGTVPSKFGKAEQ